MRPSHSVPEPELKENRKRESGRSRRVPVALVSLGVAAFVFVVLLGDWQSGSVAHGGNDIHASFESSGSMVAMTKEKGVPNPLVNACIAKLVPKSKPCFGENVVLSDMARLESVDENGQKTETKLSRSLLVNKGKNLDCTKPVKMEVVLEEDEDIPSEIMLKYSDGTILTADVSPCQVVTLYVLPVGRGNENLEEKEDSQGLTKIGGDCLGNEKRCSSDSQCCTNKCRRKYIWRWGWHTICANTWDCRGWWPRCGTYRSCHRSWGVRLITYKRCRN